MAKLDIAESGLVRGLSAGQRAAPGQEHGESTGVVGLTPGRNYEDEGYAEDIAHEEMPQADAEYDIEEWDHSLRRG